MWTNWPVWFRLLIALALFAAGALILIFGPRWFFLPRFAGIGLGLIGLGFGALVFSNKSSSEKKGYRF